MKNSMLTIAACLILQVASALAALHIQTEPTSGGPATFPGVSRELASFCSGRPALPIDLVAMVVHVKRNVSFNYKLYLFSPDHVIQTGQVIPRDDFRVHSFPVKLKPTGDFWPVSGLPTFAYSNNQVDSLHSIPSDTFQLKQMLLPVPLNPSASVRGSGLRKSAKVQHVRRAPEDAHGEPLPGDPEPQENRMERENLNSHIRFDRDDELSVSRRAVYSDHLDYLEPERVSHDRLGDGSSRRRNFDGDFVVPVGSFSSFHLNTSYLARKDFGQREPQIIRIQVEPNQFQVTRLELISNGTQPRTSYPANEDYNFLSHKLLRSPNTRITAINQIYEDWITRNFYTIVYIQRKLEDEEDPEDEGGEDKRASTIVTDRLVFRGSSTSLLGADQLDYTVTAAAFITEKNGLHYYLEFLPQGKFYLAAVDWTKRPFKMIDSRRFPIKATRTLLDNEELLLCPPAVCYSNQPVDELVSFGRLALSRRTQRDAALLSSTSSTSSSTTSWTKADRTNVVALESPASFLTMNETSIRRQTNNKVDLMRESRESELVTGVEADGDQPAQHFAENISLDNVIEEIKLAAGHLQTRLHLRDWMWILSRSVNSNNGSRTVNQRQGPMSPNKLLLLRNNQQGSRVSKQTDERGKFEFRYELARRNDIKVKLDTYGYVLTGNDVDASYRVYNELYLISANHLITINYTMADETSVSSRPIGEEFLGLESSLMDPITGGFYDRYNNQLYFFKGDRYVGYDYATKKPLDEFVLPETNANVAGLQMDLAAQDQSMAAAPLVSSLPVIDILGRQHQVDGVYHDFSTDLVYIFTGMKFYTFQAAEFKNGSFREDGQELPQMFCINENFLHGCSFDEAFPNPCHIDEPNPPSSKSSKLELEGSNKLAKELLENNRLNFTEEQQMKLRSIAGRSGLLNFLLENSILNNGPVRSIVDANPMATDYQDKLVFYLLIAMVGLTVLLIVVMIVMLINWTRLRLSEVKQLESIETGKDINQMPESRTRHYLSNQHHHQHRRPRSNSSHLNSNTTIIKSSSTAPVGMVVSKSGRRLSGVIDNSVL